MREKGRGSPLPLVTVNKVFFFGERTDNGKYAWALERENRDKKLIN